ncbi:hypothetical protein FEK43_09935 [Escherichia sp. E2562]|nr:hypothetical protein FEK66_08315 [Escherichia sp. E1130]TLI83215.1 hypothetical protein FEK43_09935 [Escherichia sp. E2562]
MRKIVYKHEKRECEKFWGISVTCNQKGMTYVQPFDFDKTLRCFSPELTDEDGILDHLIK